MNFSAPKLFRGTKNHINWWANRKIDWKTSYLDTWNHPHRGMITQILRRIDWFSLFEIGCGSGPNLVRIAKEFPRRQLGGIDVNPEAIEMAGQYLQGGHFKVGSADDIMMSDKSTDVVLSDMCLIYVSPRDIDRHIKEIKRLARAYVVLCEFHSESLWNRLKLKFNSGYNAYNYKKLLKKHGFYDTATVKIPESAWPGGDPQKTFGYLIISKVPKR